MSLTQLLAFSGFLGGVVFARTAQFSDVAWATIGGITTALITTAGGIAIALINRPARRRRASESREQEEDDDADS